MKKIFFTLIFFSVFSAYSQIEVGNNLFTGTVDTTRTVQNLVLKNRTKIPEHALALNIGYNVPIWNNSLINKNFWHKKTGAIFEFSLDYRKQIFKNEIINDELNSYPTWWAFGVGVGVSYMSKTVSFDSFSELLNNYTDVDGDICDVSLNYQNVKEAIRLMYLDIPLYIEIGKPSRVKISGFFKLGFKGSILVSKKITCNGTYTSTGKYSEKYEVTLHDVPELGYYTDADCYSNPKYNANLFVLWGTVSGGVNIPFRNLEKNKLAVCILRLSAKIDYTITPIGKKMGESYFKGTAFRLNQSNLLGGNGSRILAPGIMASFIFCL